MEMPVFASYKEMNTVYAVIHGLRAARDMATYDGWKHTVFCVAAALLRRFGDFDHEVFFALCNGNDELPTTK